MDQKESPPPFMSALTTEHFVPQGALSANTSEVAPGLAIDKWGPTM